MREIIINETENLTTVALVENGILIEKYEEKENQNRLEGNIYIGKVENVLQGMQAAFVDIGVDKNTFIHLKDVLPKKDVKNSEGNELEEEDIRKVLKTGMPIMVQVKRDSTNKKGARVSKHISLPGRYLVLMPDTDFVTISQKIENEEEKQRLINTVKGVLPKGYGAIIRTSTDGKNEDDIKKDVQALLDQWEDIKEKAKESQNNAPALIYQNQGFIKKFIIDLIDKKIDKILVNNDKLYNMASSILKELSEEKISVVLNKKDSILDIYDIDDQIEKLSHRKIWLKCGGFITIDKTEALTAIDVNSGKYIGKEEPEATKFLVNKEASIEIARQLKLRDIGGIIIIDYIDMEEEKSKIEIINILKDNLKLDRSKTQIAGFSKLNLLEMTRKHMYSNEE